jgi:hypothetical protein
LPPKIATSGSFSRDLKMTDFMKYFVADCTGYLKSAKYKRGQIKIKSLSTINRTLIGHPSQLTRQPS